MPVLESCLFDTPGQVLGEQLRFHAPDTIGLHRFRGGVHEGPGNGCEALVPDDEGKLSSDT